jgi:hypothetical protein
MVGDARFELTTELDGTQTNFGFSKSIILDFQRVFKRWSVMQDLKLRLNLMTPKLILDFQRVFKRWSVMQDSNLRLNLMTPKPILDF